MSPLTAWLILAAAPGIGPRTCSRLLSRLGTPAGVLAASAATLRELGINPDGIAALQEPDTERLNAALAWAEQADAHILTRDDSRYPPLLREIHDPPLLLFVRGNPLLLAEPQIAIVGSRNPSFAGREITRDFASRLAACGLAITSGLATGIDGVAHQGALETGRTIAVLGTGPDRVYPASHRDLAQRIVATGALVTEFPPGQGPLPQNFPQRNRIIAGLSLGTLVTEAALRSGSLITARLAAEQGREVFAVPGSIRNPLARGCHALIRDGATLVEEPAEVIAALESQLRSHLSALDLAPSVLMPQDGPLITGHDRDYQRLLDALGFDPVAPDELIQRTGLAAEAVSSMLLVLELEGHVSSRPGGRFSRVS